MRFYRDSGFAAVGDARPRVDQPLDWLVWHFTTWANLEKVVYSGGLLCDRQAESAEPVGNPGIKSNRMNRSVVLQPPETGYPRNVTVGDHVPFYFAPRSPMLYVVLQGSTEYKGDHTGLVMLGTCIRTVVESNLAWCVSDRNAGTHLVRFSQALPTLGDFIDFELMTQFDWRNTEDDPDRQSRRAAEFLVLTQVPLTTITHVVTSTPSGAARAGRMLQDVGSAWQYDVKPRFLYQ